MDPLELLIKNWYLPMKAERSRAEAIGKHRAPLPQFPGANNGYSSQALAKAINSYLGPFKYRLDPMNGIWDYYNHPEHSVWRHQKGETESPMDCDDFAVLAYCLFKTNGVKPENLRLWNLIVSAPAQLGQAWANHVICGFAYYDGAGEPWTGAIDTNTAARNNVFWFRGHPNTTQAQNAVIARFKAIYNADYYKLIADNYPF